MCAVEFPKATLTSSDISFDLELIGNVQQPAPPSTGATLVINTPHDGETFVAPAEIVITATAVDPKGYISRVEFFANDHSIGVSELQFFRAPDPGTPIQHHLPRKSVPAGKYILTAKAKDGAGNQIISRAVTISVTASTGGTGPTTSQPSAVGL